MRSIGTFLFSAALLTLASCPGSSDPTPFVGVWKVSGNATITCGTGSNAQANTASSVSPVDGYQITLAVGTQSDLVSLDTGGCQVLWSVSGDTATSQPSPACTLSDGTAATVKAGSMTLKVVDHNTLSGSANLSGTLTGCADTVTAVLAGQFVR